MKRDAVALQRPSYRTHWPRDDVHFRLIEHDDDDEVYVSLSLYLSFSLSLSLSLSHTQIE